MEHLPASIVSHKYVFVVVDYIIKWAELWHSYYFLFTQQPAYLPFTLLLPTEHPSVLFTHL